MFLGQKPFVWDGTEKQTLFDFRVDLACDLILNPYRVVNPLKQRTSKQLWNNIVMHESKMPIFYFTLG